MGQVKGHLALLHSFASLRAQIQDLPTQTSDSEHATNYMPYDQDARWAWFVSLAVERFTHWCESLTSSDASRPAAEFLPPIDVLMVWHAYLLNPGSVSCAKVKSNVLMRSTLVVATPIFSASLDSDLLSILTGEPTEARSNFWTSKTGREFNALDDTFFQRNIKEFPCPKCQKPCKTALMSKDGTGYLQHDFQIYCDMPGCQMLSSTGSKMYITRNLLRARKFVDDLFREGKGLDTYLA
ncbi:hypothetical protein H0H87_007795 [Tephrocybe sp. NHM501043]|nr:hypothetical protein H0H87_007795 [Tephrocybe sp. NHM501043]